MDLIEFLRARLDEDEATARTAFADDDRLSGHWRVDTFDAGHGGSASVEDAGSGVTVAYDEGAPTLVEAAHIARWDPARVLAEVEAKRRVIDLLAPPDPHDADSPCHDCAVLCALAQPYVDHPDFDPAWKPVLS